MNDLTKKEAKILLDHFARDYDYGVGGTWGDGDDWTAPKTERASAAKIIEKLEKFIYA